MQEDTLLYIGIGVIAVGGLLYMTKGGGGGYSVVNPPPSSSGDALAAARLQTGTQILSSLANVWSTTRSAELEAASKAQGYQTALTLADIQSQTAIHAADAQYAAQIAAVNAQASAKEQAGLFGFLGDIAKIFF